MGNAKCEMGDLAQWKKSSSRRDAWTGGQDAHPTRETPLAFSSRWRKPHELDAMARVWIPLGWAGDEHHAVAADTAVTQPALRELAPVLRLLRETDGGCTP